MDFTEAYQVDVLRHVHKALDHLKQEFLTGELVWHFADFMTAQGNASSKSILLQLCFTGVKRVAGNRKGVLTRNRQPKMAAYEMRQRYRRLDHEHQ